MIKIGSGWGLLVLALVIGLGQFWCSNSDKHFVPDGARDGASKNMIYLLVIGTGLKPITLYLKLQP